jgi:hypothetical protein
MKLSSKKMRLLIVFFGIILISGILYFYSMPIMEGYASYSGPQTWNQSTISSVTTQLLKVPNSTSASVANTIQQYQNWGVTDSQASAYAQSGSWDWDPAFTSAVNNFYINNPSVIPSGKTTAQVITQGQSQYPQEWITDMEAYETQNALTQAFTPAKIGCNVDASGNLTGTSPFQLDAQGNLTTTVVANADLPTLIPGFSFLSDVCNPCVIMSNATNKYSCPIALPDVNKQPLMPNPFMNYLWGIFTPSSSSSGVSGVSGASSALSSAASSVSLPSI